jgi:hypothetical protein
MTSTYNTYYNSINIHGQIIAADYDFFIRIFRRNCRFHGTHEGVGVMVFNATFNNISVISWRSVLLVEETAVPGKNHRPATIR